MLDFNNLSPPSKEMWRHDDDDDDDDDDGLYRSISNSKDYEDIFFDALEDNFHSLSNISFRNSIRNIQRNTEVKPTKLFDDEELWLLPSKGTLVGDSRRNSFNMQRRHCKDVAKELVAGRRKSIQDVPRYFLHSSKTLCNESESCSGQEASKCSSPKKCETSGIDSSKERQTRHEKLSVLRPNAGKLKERRRHLKSWNSPFNINSKDPPPLSYAPFSQVSTSPRPGLTTSLSKTAASSDSFHPCRSTDWLGKMEPQPVEFIPFLDATKRPRVDQKRENERQREKMRHLSTSMVSLIGKETPDVSSKEEGFQVRREKALTSVHNAHSETNDVIRRKRVKQNNSRKRRSLIKSCIYPETSSEEFSAYSFPSPLRPLITADITGNRAFHQSLAPCKSDGPMITEQINSPMTSALTMRLRRATSSVKKELRKTFRSWSVVLSPSPSPATMSEGAFSRNMSFDLSSKERVNRPDSLHFWSSNSREVLSSDAHK